MEVASILEELRALGTDGIKRILMNHGALEPCFGVKVEELQKIRKRIKKDHAISLALFDSGIYDAMYLAGLVADDAKMSKKELHHWVKTAGSPPIGEYTVAWVTAEGRFGWELALEWIDSKKESIAAAGWSTLSSLVALKPDAELDLPTLEKLLKRVETTIHDQPNRVRYTMNGFVIALGSYVASLTERAIEAAGTIGKVKVNVGNTECKVPDAVEYIRKVQTKGTIGKKKKTVKC